MFVTYTPSGEEPQEWVFKPGDMLNRESEQIEKVTGLTWEEFLQQLQRGLTIARRALLWTLLRRNHSVLRFPDIEFRQGDLKVEYDRGELEEIRAGLLEPGAQTRAEKSGQDLDAMLAAVEQQLEKAREDPAPKAPANSSASATSTPSPSPGVTPSPAES
jgi:hypothetical protein